MRKSQNKPTGRLKQQMKTVLQVPLRAFAPEEVHSLHPSDTLGYLADQLRMPSALLLAQFQSAGISGLTPSHNISQDDKAALLNYLRIQHSSPAEKIYEDPAVVDSKLIVVKDITNELLRQLAAEPSLMHQLEPRKFEELVARLLENQGCEVTLTKRTRDGGYDIFGRMNTGPASLIFLAECKRYSPENKVGVEFVRGLYGVTEIKQANFGLLITSSTFTKDAKAEKIRIGSRIELKEYQDLCVWLNARREKATTPFPISNNK